MAKARHRGIEATILKIVDNEPTDLRKNHVLAVAMRKFCDRNLAATEHSYARIVWGLTYEEASYLFASTRTIEEIEETHKQFKDGYRIRDVYVGIVAWAKAEEIEVWAARNYLM